MELDRKKNETLENTFTKVTKDFGSIFNALLPGTQAKLSPPEGGTVLVRRRTALLDPFSAKCYRCEHVFHANRSSLLSFFALRRTAWKSAWPSVRCGKRACRS